MWCATSASWAPPRSTRTPWAPRPVLRLPQGSLVCRALPLRAWGRQGARELVGRDAIAHRLTARPPGVPFMPRRGRGSCLVSVPWRAHVRPRAPPGTAPARAPLCRVSAREVAQGRLEHTDSAVGKTSGNALCALARLRQLPRVSREPTRSTRTPWAPRPSPKLAPRPLGWGALPLRAGRRQGARGRGGRRTRGLRLLLVPLAWSIVAPDGASSLSANVLREFIVVDTVVLGLGWLRPASPSGLCLLRGGARSSWSCS